MALCPFAVQKLLPESATQGKIIPRGMILHSAAGMGSLYRFFLNSSNLESHFWVGLDGTIEQYMDTGVRADANLNGNGFLLSAETENTNHAVQTRDWDSDPWSPQQIASLIKLCDWCAIVHPAIKRQQIPVWDGSGLGWHVMFGAPGPYTGYAKVCPGRTRIEQFKSTILPAFVAGTTPSPTTGALMALTDAEQDEVLKNTRDTKAKVDAMAQALVGENPKLGNVFVRILTSLKRIELKLKSTPPSSAP